MKKHYNKLVRDKIPDIIESDDRKCEYEILSDTDFLPQLIKKFPEEVQEIIDAYNEKNVDNLVEELGDLQVLIYTLLEYYGLDTCVLDNAVREKAEKRGMFEKKIFLKWADEPK